MAIVCMQPEAITTNWLILMNMLNTVSNDTVYVNVRPVHINGSGIQKKNVATLRHILSGPIAEKDANKAIYM